MVPHQGGLSQGWSLIRVVYHQGGPSSVWSSWHQGGPSSGWSVTREVPHQGGLSPGWSFISVVTCQGGISSGWSISRVVSQGGLSSGWSFIRVASPQGGLSLGCSLTLVVPYQCGPSPGGVSHQGDLSPGVQLKYRMKITSVFVCAVARWASWVWLPTGPKTRTFRSWQDLQDSSCLLILLVRWRLPRLTPAMGHVCFDV